MKTAFSSLLLIIFLYVLSYIHRWDFETMQLADSNPGEMNPPLVMLHMEPKMDFIPEDVDYIAPLYKTGLRAGTLSTTGTCSHTPPSPLLVTLIPFFYPTYSTPCYPHPTSFSPLSLTSPPLVTLSTTCLFFIIMRLLRALTYHV